MTFKVKAILSRSFIFPLITISLLSVYSCNHGGSSSSNGTDSTNASPVAVLTHKIDTLHELVMDKIGPLRRLEDSVRSRMKITAHNNKDTSSLSQLANALNSSDTAMFGWMGQYSTNLNSKSDSEKVVYLQSQFQKLDQLNVIMDSVMNAARKEVQ